MCNCGCNTCETKGPLLTEGKVKSLLSEGLQYHINKKIPLFETVYRIGSDKHLSLIKEARKMYSRNVIDLCEEDEALIKTHLGEFALYEGVSVPLDLPMLNETNKISDDKLMRLIPDLPKGYVGKNTGIGKYTILTPNGEDVVLTQSKDKKNWSYEPSNVALKTLNEDTSALNEGKAIITFKNDYEVKMNTGEGYDDGFEYFEAGEREQVYILDKNDKRTHVEFGDGTNAFIPSDVISIQEKSLNEDNRKHALLKVEPRNYEAMIDKLQDMNINHRRESDTVIKVYTDGISDKIIYNLTHDVYVDKFVLKEALFKGKDVPLNKPKRGGSKAYYVYVRDPKTKKIKKVSFGSGGLRAKIKNKEARNAFAKRHRCKDKKDRTKAGYWSCNLPRYASALGLGANMNTFW